MPDCGQSQCLPDGFDSLHLFPRHLGNSPLSVDDLQSSGFPAVCGFPDRLRGDEPTGSHRPDRHRILRAYGKTLSLTSSQATALASGWRSMCKEHTMHSFPNWERAEQSYALPWEMPDQPSALSDRLGIPSATEVQQLLLGRTRRNHAGVTIWSAGESTRGPLDTVPTPDLLTWRLQRLRTGWKTQDAPVQYPADVPILDPDVLDFSNLRRGWDSTHATTTRWNARRTSIDTQLRTSQEPRTGCGSSRHDDHAADGDEPTEDQKWAAHT